MARFSFTDHAENDLVEIVDYSNETWGVRQTTKYIDGFYAQAQIISENPNMGLERSTLAAGLFSFPFESHVIFYFQEPKGIIITRVLHKKMDWVRHSFE